MSERLYADPVVAWSPSQPVAGREIVGNDSIAFTAPSAPKGSRLPVSANKVPDAPVGAILDHPRSMDDDADALSLDLVRAAAPTRHPATNVRGRHDDFQTPPEAVTALLPFLPRKAVIWEPAAGKGQVVATLLDAGHRVIASDVKTGQDFRAWQPSEPWDVQVTNPPYSIKDLWIARSYALKKPFALLLPLTCLEGQMRQSLYHHVGLELICLPRRCDFTTPSGKVGGSWFACAWFTWGLNIGRALTFTGYDAAAQPSLSFAAPPACAADDGAESAERSE